MNLSIIISVFTISLSISAKGQVINDTLPKVNLSAIAIVNQGNSYITFPLDIGNIEPLWFEGNIIPNFLIRKSKNSRLMGVLTPQIIIRMFREESMPVRTPSYMPQIAVYYNIANALTKNQHTLFGRFVHHSNGQEGDFYLPDGEINLMTGNFSTNFLELGVINNHYNQQLNAVQFYSSSLELHLPGWSVKELEGKYSMVRWHNALSIYKIPVGRSRADNSRAQLSLKAEAMCMFGDINNWQQLSLDRFNANFTFYYHPTFLEEIGLFVQAYTGMDYYNIYFENRIQIIRFGIMTEKLTF